MKHILRAAAALILILLALAASAAADTAEDISAECTYTASQREKLFRLTDGRTKQIFEGNKNKENWIEVETPRGKSAAALYFNWRAETPEVLLERYDASAGDYVAYKTVNTGAMLHEYVPVDGLTRFRLRSSDKTGMIALTELTVLTEGDTPDWVQVWQPPCEDADILFFVAHPDDELIFFGGAIPYYAQERGLHVAVAYMTCKDEIRRHELLNGLWTAGVREYPYMLGFYDKLCFYKTRTAYKYWGGEDAALDAAAGLIDTTHARVIVTQDVNGEYGHGEHMAVADLMLRIVRDGERTLKNPPQKLYLHLWEENPIEIGWETPMADGRTPLEVAASAFKCHESQQGYSQKTRSGKTFRFEVKADGMYSNSKFGLAWTSVGPDEARNDFMEHASR